MEQWRLATSKENFVLAENAGREVNRTEGGEPNRYSTELTGSAVVALAPDPPDSQLYLFKFVPVAAKAANGVPATRLLPVPYELHSRNVVAAGLQPEMSRAQTGPAVLAGRHSSPHLETVYPAAVA